MVRIRQRRQAGSQTGVLSHNMLFDDEGVAYFLTPPGTPENQPVRLETRGSSTKPSSPKKLGSSSSANQSDHHPNAKGSTSGKRKLDLPSPDGKTKPRKKGKINHTTKEPEKLRGVYFKNQKWQAVIKVDKELIHLGTFDSQAEAACLYDRAAFLCGGKPNFELPKEDIQELIKLNWEQFMKKIKDGKFTKSARRRQTAAGPLNKSNSPVVEPRAKRALSFSEGPKPEGSPSSSGWLWPVVHGPTTTSKTAAGPPNKSNSPAVEPSEGPKSEEFSSSSGWLWPIVHGPATGIMKEKFSPLFSQE